MNVEVVANPKNQGLAFKFFVVIALIVLFALFLYAILGPTPNQSKFLKQSGVAGSLAVNGTSLLNGDVVIGGNTAMNGIMNVIGAARAQTSLSTPELDLITTANGVDTIQGKILGKTSGTVQIQGSTDVTITDGSGTNNIVKFTGSNKQTDFYGDVILNDPNGSSALILKNQSNPNSSYEIYNDSTSSDFTLISKNGSTVKNIIDANSSGNIITLFDVSSTNPLLYVNGTKGGVPTLGRVYDSEYNLPPYLNNTFATITVTGLSSLNTVTTTGNLTVGGVLNTRAQESDVQAINFYQLPSSTSAGGRLASSDGNTSLFLQGSSNVEFSPIGNPNSIAVFNTSEGLDVRSNKENPVFDLKGFMKYTLPSYITTGGVTYNSFSYTSSSTATVIADATGWPSTAANYVGGWSSTQTGANYYIVTTGSVASSGWRCPKRGIWQVTFDSNLNPFNGAGAMVLSLAIGNIYTTPQTIPYGIDKVNTFAVINQNDIIVVTPQSGSGLLTGIQPKMTFSLIMELNPATTT